MPTESTTFTIEQLQRFMSENDIERNIIHYYSGLQMPSAYYIAAFEHWCLTGENVMDEWDNIQELIVLTKKSSVGGVIKVGSDIQFISEAMLLGFRDVIAGTTFWNINHFLQEENLSLESCAAFVDEVNRLLEEERERAARYQKRQEEKIKKEEARKNKVDIIYVITNNTPVRFRLRVVRCRGIVCMLADVLSNSGPTPSFEKLFVSRVVRCRGV